MDKICKIRWNKDDFSEVNMTTKKLRDIENGTETTYDIGGGDITVEPLSVTENGEYIAPEGKAYTPVTVNVPASGYSETLLWTNPNPGTGFNTDLIMGDYIPGVDEYSHLKIVYKYINNQPGLGTIIIDKTELITNGQGTSICSFNENGDAFARAIVIEGIEIQEDPPYFESRVVARGLCSQIGVDNEKKFRCIPYQLYGVIIE